VKNKVKELRAKSNMTQEHLAERLGVSRQTVISIENGRYNPSLILAYKIACIFSCSIEEIFDFTEVNMDE
jgi:putative transcriptional regulator